MGDSNRIQDAFGAASEFLNPVLNRDELQKSQGKSLLAILSQIPDVSAESNEAVRTEVIGRALKILNQIHTAFVTPAGQQDELLLEGEREDEALEDAKRRRMLHALLDLISLEGIYPSLSSGVGIPLQQRVISVLPAGVIAKQVSSVPSSTPHDEDLLRLIMGVLLDIASDGRSSIQPVIRGRILSDIISGAADLAFNPNMPANDHQSKFQKGFLDFVHDTPSAVLLPTLSSFLQSDATAWFKSTVSAQISQVPLRPGGVLQTIMFIASQFAPSLGQEAQSEPSSGPHFTVQAIMQISRLLSSVPQGIEAESYFKIIAPQLLALLDGDDPDLMKTASYTIGSGILGKRAFGAPGTTGHLIFVEPIFRALTAELNNASSRWMDRYSDIEGSKPLERGQKLSNNTLVDDELVELAINRLKSLSLQHPNPGLVKRIIYPILVPLWGLACYSKEQDFIQLHGKVMALLQAYFGISVGVPPLKKLVDNLLWDGGSSWTYATASEGRVALRRRIEVGEDQSNFIKLIDSLQSRTELFVELLGSDPSSEERTGDIFLYVSETWLVKSHEPDEKIKSSKPQHIDKTNNIIQQLVSAKIAEKLLDNFKDTLSRRPLRVLELIKQVIDGELSTKSAQEARRRDQKSGKPSLSSLAHIVQDENQKEEEEESDNEASEYLSAAFSLLSTVLASPDFAISRETKASLECIKDRLDRLIPLLPTALSKPATTSSMLLEIQLTSPEHDDMKPLPAHISDLETHRQALANLNSELPPIQAEGFSLLSKLIMNSSPVLDIPSTLTLLLSIIIDVSESSANEEFIYLNAIKLIGTLSSRHPRTVVKTLVDSYADKTEKKTLDQRLKIGESLLRTVQDLGEALTGETAKILGEGMVAVAGRRGQKPQAQKSRRQQEEKERRRQEREERKQKEPVMPVGFSIPTGTFVSKTQAIPDEDDDENDISADESPEHAANVVAAWAAGASADEEPDDLRVRASALSILASAIQTNIIGLGPALISSAVSLALATITLEPSVESAILRRASAVLILDILKAFDTAREERNGREIGFGFSLTDETSGHFADSQDQNIRGPSTVGNIPSMLRTLGFVESRETDSIVRGHLRVLIESLEAWMEKSLMWGIAAQMGEGDATEPRLELGDRIAGLDLDPVAGRNAATRPRIEEIE